MEHGQCTLEDLGQKMKEQPAFQQQTPLPIPRCRFCRTRLRDTFADLGMSPLANSYLRPEQLNQMEPFYPLHVYVCERCFLVQLEAYEHPENIFNDQYAYFASYSDSWLQHAKCYVDMITARLGLTQESQVVEIASNDGYLLRNFVENGIPALGVEPSASVARAAIQIGIPTRIQFFGRQTASELVSEGIRADLLIGNNVLAHVPDVNDLVEGIKIILKPMGTVSMEFHYLMRLMEEQEFDTIYHEHFSYFSFTTARQVFAEHRLKIFDVEEIAVTGGSLRIYACNEEDTSRTISQRAQDLLAREEAAGLTCLEHYRSFYESVKATKRRILTFLIQAKAEGKSIVGYGAAAKANTLMNYCGIGSDFIEYTVDRSPYKQGHFLPGTHIPIHHPDKIRETKPDYLLIFVWNIKDEIMEQMAYIREWGGQFVVLIPEVKIYP